MSTSGHLKFQGTNRATFVGTTSNIMFDTTSTSLGIGVTGTDHPSSNLYVTGNAYVSSNIAVGGVLTMGTVNVVARHDLEAVTALGNTTPVTLEFTNPTTSLVASGNVVVTGNVTADHFVGDGSLLTGITTIESNVDLIRNTDNTAFINLNSNVVTEFPRSKKLIKYPRVAMTANSSGGYVADQTNTASHGNADAYAYRLFDNTSGAYQSGSAYSSGNPTASAPTTTASDGSTHQGVAITLDLVTKIRLDHVVITSHANYGRTPVDGTFLGSDNSSVWDVIQTFSGLSTSADNQKHTITITNSSQKLAYRYIRFVITKTHTSPVFNAGSLLEFRELQYFGVPEYDPEAHGTDVTVKSVANVPNTDWLEVYYDAKNYTSGTITDESPNSYVGTLNGNTQLENVNGIKAFKFDGTGDNIRGTIPSISGEYVHSISLWVKVEDGLTYTLFEMGVRSTDDLIGISISSGTINYYFFSNDNSYPSITPGSWHHLTFTYSGGSNLSNRKVYIDGNEVFRTAHTGGSTGALTLGNGNFTIGDLAVGTGTNDLKGSIANFRLFNRDLTSDEIYQLYAYQKEYFGHGDLSMTLKAGRLGIGTSEPRAMLDVRGGIYAPGIVQIQSSSFTGNASGANINFTTISGLTTRITPKSRSSKIFVMLNLYWAGISDSYFQGNVKRDGTVIAKNDGIGSASATSFAMLNYDRPTYFLGNVGFSYLDTPNTDNEIEYTVEVRNRGIGNYTWYINRTSDTADANRLTAVSTLTLIEVQQ